MKNKSILPINGGGLSGNSFSSGNKISYPEKRGFLFILPLFLLILLLAQGSFTTLSGQNNWTGTTSASWGNSSNWSLNRVPLSTDDVVIPNNATGANDNPTVDVTAVCASLTMSSGNLARTLNFSGTSSLTVSGAVSIQQPTIAVAKTIAVAAGSLSCASVAMANTAGDAYDCQLTITTGTVTISGNIVMSGIATENQVAFTGAGTLNIGGSITGGNLVTFAGSTVNYNGSVVQVVRAVTYSVLKCNNSASGLFTEAAITATTLTIGDQTENSFFEIRWAFTCTGTLNLVSGYFKLGYQGTPISWPGFTTHHISAGTVIEYSATSAQNVSAAPPYANLKVSGASTKTVQGNLTIHGDLTIESGTLDLLTYTANRSASGGTLTIADGATLLVKGAGNYPANFEIHALGYNSTVNYAMANAQNIAVDAYGNLTLSGGNTKTFTGSMNIRGILSIASGTVANLGTSPANSSCLVLKLNEVNQVAGTYGSTASAATYKNSTYFGTSATAILDVSDAISWQGTTSNDWFTPSNWGGGSIPTASSNVLITAASNNPTINGAGSVCHNIAIYSGSSLTITGTNTLTVYGNWSKPENAPFNANSSTVIFAGSEDRVIDGWTVFYNLVINKDAGDDKVTDPDDVWPKTSFEVTNDLTVTRGILEMNGSDWDYFIGSDIIIGAAGTLVSNHNYPLRVRGDWTNNGGSYDHGTRNIFFDGTGDQVISGSAAGQEFYNLYVDKASGNLSVGGSTTTLTVNDLVMLSGNFSAPASLIINGTANLSSGTLVAGTSTSVRGSWANDGTVFTPGTGTVTFDGETQSIGGTNAPLGFNNVVINSTVFAVLIANATVDGYINVNDGKTFYVAPDVSLTVEGE
jgi:hypothetical protein